ncbi:MAG: sigma factor-like helix-turn-helix DNA-binding protein [Acidimicrobiales bacterium]|jgi:RNA polymerase sigma-70 factor (ECF subfamily)
MAVGGTDQWEFEQWYKTSRKALTGAAFLYVGNMDEALDLVQETYARAWQHWDVVCVHANRDAWSRLVLHNLAVSRWRRLARERALIRPTEQAQQAPDAHDVDLARLVARLPANQRRAFVLHVVFDLSIDDVASEMEAPAGTVRSWIHRARTTLAAQIESDTRLMARK